MSEDDFVKFKAAALGYIKGTVTAEEWECHMRRYGELNARQYDDLCKQAWDFKVTDSLKRCAELAALLEDKARLDWLDAQAAGDGWIAEECETGRRFLLYSTSAQATVREAIDRARKND